jgi:transcription antitermination factor NusG
MDRRTFDNKWFALQVRTGLESVCSRALGSKGYEEFLPLSTKAGVRAQALFPGYLFCRINGDVKGLVVTTPGVIRIVGCGGIPSPIADEEIATIRSVVESGCPTYSWPYLQTGQKVRLTGGPLEGAEGILLQVKNCQRLVVSISLLQRSVAVQVNAEWVARTERVVGSPRSSCSTAALHKPSYAATQIPSLRGCAAAR